MHAGWSLLFLAPLIAAGSAAASPQDLCVITILPNAAFTEVVVRADEVYNESLKADLAQEVDANHDGAVDAGEEAAYEAASQKVVYELATDSYAPLPELGEKRLFLDDKSPTRIEFRTELSNVLGSTHETDSWLITDVRTFSFDAEPDLHTHRVRGGNGSSPEPRVKIEFVVARAPQGWLVHRVNGTLYDEPEVSLPEFDTTRFYTIYYADRAGLDFSLPAEGEPGFGAWAALAGLSVAACLGRLRPPVRGRRRRGGRWGARLRPSARRGISGAVEEAAAAHR